MIVDGKYVDEHELAFYAKHDVEAEGHRLSWHDLAQRILMARIGQLDSGSLSVQEYQIECSVCGERVPVYFDGRNFVALNACKYRFGGIPLTFFLKVPSGALAVANDMRYLLTPSIPPDTREYYINGSIGTVNTSEWYANRDMAHAFVGNTCPGLHRLTEDHYQVSSGHTGYEADDDYVDAPGEQIASIITDLWWYSMMDAVAYEALGGQWDRWTTKVNVKPGLWRFVHHTEESDFDRDDWTKDTIYTDITWAASL